MYALEGEFPNIRVPILTGLVGHDVMTRTLGGGEDAKSWLTKSCAETELCGEQGKVRAVGLSNFSLDQLKECQAIRQIDVVQYGLSMYISKSLMGSAFSPISLPSTTLTNSPGSLNTTSSPQEKAGMPTTSL